MGCDDKRMARCMPFVPYTVPYMAMVGCMSGSIREKRPGQWEVRVSLGRDPVTGAARSVSKSVRGTKRDAQKTLTALSHAVVFEADPAPTGSVGELISLWLDHIEREGRSPTTMEGYRKLERQVPAYFLKKPLRNVTPQLMVALYEELGKKEGRGPARTPAPRAVRGTDCPSPRRGRRPRDDDHCSTELHEQVPWRPPSSSIRHSIRPVVDLPRRPTRAG